PPSDRPPPSSSTLLPYTTLFRSHCVLTNGSGKYTIPSLRSGEYKVRFAKFGFALQFYNEQTQENEANLVKVTAGETTPNINAALDRQRTRLNASHQCTSTHAVG